MAYLLLKEDAGDVQVGTSKDGPLVLRGGKVLWIVDGSRIDMSATYPGGATSLLLALAQGRMKAGFGLSPVKGLTVRGEGNWARPVLNGKDIG